MPVNTVHRAYATALPQWTRCRDTYEGSDGVKRRTTAYLPLLEGHVTTTGAYMGYLMRALFYPALARTVGGLAGLTFAKLPTVSGVPKALQAHFDDVTLSGLSLGAYGLTLCHETLITGRVGTLIDFPALPTNGARPYWVLYAAEQITNWSVKRINGQQMLTRIVLWEEVEVDNPDDAFALQVQKQYRVLELLDGRYTVTIYTEDAKNLGTFLKGASHVPLRRGEPLPFIPFVFLGPNRVGPEVVHPPLLDLVDVNLSHYRTSADHEHGAHFTALPTPYITGHKLGEGESLSIGSGRAWVLDKDASADMLEFSGAGLASLAALKQEKREMMIALGARMLETQKNTAEAAQTVLMRHAGESSAMMVFADALGQAMTQAMRWHLYWSGIELPTADLARMTMNPDVMDDLSSEDIRVLVDTWQKKGISKRTLHYNLQWGEWTRPGVTFEQEEAEIELENRPPT